MKLVRTSQAHLYVACLALVVLSLILAQPVVRAAPAPQSWPAGAPEVASYAIDVSLDTTSRQLTGRQVIRYRNTGDVAISDLVFHLYLNAFASDDTLFMQEGGASHRGFSWDPDKAGWIEVSNLRLAGGPALELELTEDGTLARAGLPAPVPPGQTVELELDFVAQLPRVFARTGYVGDFYLVGQWFPKLGVWEDGSWNAYPFHANAEFYADFGTYDVTITLPDGYVTGATGLPVGTTQHDGGTQTVRYHAEGVIDFAWTASPDFVQESRDVDGIELVYMVLPEHDWSVERALDAAEAALVHYGRWYGPYPYPRLTVVDVPDDGQGAGGMEYPMLFTAGTFSFLGLPSGSARDADRSLELVVTHEAGHQWWQSVVATNEAEEPWLDEGMTEYSSVRLMNQLYGADQSLFDSRLLEVSSLDTRRMEYLLNPAVSMAGTAWEFGLLDYVVATYSKPALSLLTLERTLGQETMQAVMSTYYERYRFGHPSTDDWVQVAREVTGQDLSWFVDGLVYGDGVLNYTVGALDDRSVTVVRQGSLPVPTEVLVTFEDGTTILEPWDGREAERVLSYPAGPSVQSAEIDPQHKVLVDLSWADNGLSQEVYRSAWMSIVTRLVYYLQTALLAAGGW